MPTYFVREMFRRTGRGEHSLKDIALREGNVAWLLFSPNMRGGRGSQGLGFLYC